MAHTERRDAPGLPDFSLLKRLARDQLIFLLEQLPGKKDLFIDADLMSPLDRIANVTILKQHEVDKLYKVELKPIVSSSDQLCFLIRPRIQTVKWISDLVNSDKVAGRFRRYKIIFTPQKFYACETVLEEQGVYGDVTTDEWNFYILPLDDDILSLELPEFFRDNFLVMLIWMLHFSKIFSMYSCYQEGMSHESSELMEEGEQRTRQPEFAKVFLIDRDVDFVTPLCSQVVYEGLVDDIFRIKCGSVEFGPNVTSSDKSIKVMLNSQDKVFDEIRNEHFSNVFGFLSQKAKNLQTAYDKRRGMDIQQMKAFVADELKGLKQEHRLLSLRKSVSNNMYTVTKDFYLKKSLLEGFEICECITHIEEHINRQVSMIDSLRLLCLLSITENGILSKDYKSLKAQYLQSYGIEHLLTFANLRQLGLLEEQQAGETLTVMESKVGKLVTDKTVGKLTDAFSSLAKKSNFRALSKRLALVPKSGEEYDLRVPRDMAYVFSGAYIPLSCKLIEQVMERDGWTGLEEVARMLNGQEFAVTGGCSSSEARNKTDAQRIVLVMFLGGCTYSEISALRFLGKERGCRFIVVTTAVTNSARLLEALLDNSA
uniref:Vacuolar protein sorting-associated protein 33B-like n=1 Tax=Sinocyclocheilus anshuiensis TaxID=1608454 RepID=A0A671K681_9TELE